MINEEKVILMTKASLYEQKEGRENLKLMKYFRHDYISLRMLGGWFFVTVAYLLCVALWGACNVEYLLNNLHKMDLKSFGLTLLLIYVAATAAYECILYGVCSYRYHTAKKSVNTYAHTLQKISDTYGREDKKASSGTLAKEMET